MQKAKEILKKYYGYDSFRDGQEALIKHVLQKRDCLGIMPTGAGKSICFQIPAILLEGVTIVISPLISLMKDQVDSLTGLGIEVALINSTLGYDEYIETMRQAKLGKYKMIYIAPERLENQAFLNMMNEINISMIAIDEAHCVSQWGHDFRPSYKKIANMITQMKNRPVVIALTATATPIVKKDIEQLLALKNPFTITTGFDRPNLSYHIEKPKKKIDFLLSYLQDKKEISGIIYCNTRKNVESVCDNLNHLGIKATKYHAGLSESKRKKNQEDFIYDKKPIIVATNAFGMGIDKPNIRFVIHYNMPKDMESYYQEAGRAGRDGDNAECILLYSAADIITNKFLIELSEEEETRKNEYKKLNEMVNFCNTSKCLRAYIISYFGETVTFENCKSCSNCNNEFAMTNITVESQKILSCIKRIGERFGSAMVADVLKGSKNKRLKEFGFDILSTYAIMSEYTKDSIKELISYLISENYIAIEGDKFPVLKLNEASYKVLKGEEQVEVRLEVKKEEDKHIITNYDTSLFEQLRELRAQLAAEEGRPPYMIFGDVALKEMCAVYPKTREELLKITGIGTKLYEKYGTVILDIILDYITENEIDTKQYTDQPNQEQQTIKTTSRVKGETVEQTIALFKQGKTIDEIVKERGLTINTIQNHLIEGKKMYPEVILDDYIQTKYKDQIVEAINTHGTTILRAIKDELPRKVTYFDIKYYIAFPH